MNDRISSRHGRLLIASLTLGAAALVAAIGWYYLRQRSAIEAAAFEQLDAVTTMKVGQISNWRRERIGDGRVFESSQVIRTGKTLLSNGVVDRADMDRLLSVMRRLQQEFLYTGAALVDRNGTIRLQINAALSDPRRIGEVGQAAARSSSTSLTDLYWDPKVGRPLMALTVPVQGSGAFVFTIDPESFLYPYIKLWPVPSATAETLLLRREGEKYVYLADDRFKPDTALRFWRSLPSTGYTRRSDGSTSVWRTVDYRGARILRIVRPIPGSDWYVGAQIDDAEIDAPVSRLGWEMAAIILLIALANTTGAAFIWRARQIRIHREREGWLHQVLNETPAFLWMTNAEGANAFVNAPFSEFVGMKDISGGIGWAHLHPDEAERGFKHFMECLRTRSEYTDQHRVRRFDGEYRWFLSTGRPRFSSDGKFLGYAGAGFDITERKSAEDRARGSAELVNGQNRVLQLIARNAPLSETLDTLVRVIEALSPEMLGSILLLDPDRIHVRHGAAPSLPEEYTRAIDGEAIGPTAGSCGTAAFRHEPVIVEDISTDPLWEGYRQFALQHGLRACWSTPIMEDKGADGQEVLGTFALYFRSPRRPADHDRELIDMATQTAAIAILKDRDLTQQKHAEEEIRQRDARLMEAQRIAHLGSFEWEIATNKVYRSAELCNIFGISSEEFEPTLEGYLKRVHPDDRDGTKGAIEAAFQDGKDFDREERIIRPEGSVRTLRSQVHVVCDSEGRPEKLIGTCQDITDRKRVEQQLQTAYAALENELEERAAAEREIKALSARLMNAQEEERSRLARELHDDLSQQIAALGIAMSNLKREIPSEWGDMRSKTERIREGLTRLGEGTRRLSHELHPAMLQHSGLDAALRAYCVEFSSLAGIEIVFSSEGLFTQIPPAVALCAYRITQEALQNVVKHAQTDRADVTLTRSGDTLTLVISDDGIGMKPDAVRASGGLGFTSIRERARLVNGHVTIQSSPERGTALRVSLPLHSDNPTGSQTAPENSFAATGSTRTRAFKRGAS